jgi:predicted phosphoribosyltransferase
MAVASNVHADPSMRLFRDRRDAGRQLAERFDAYADRSDVVVLALPRGGVPVGYEIALRAGAPLDVLVVRKLGVPGHSELAMGAIASGGIEIVDQRIVTMLGISRELFEHVERHERAELARRERVFRDQRPALDVATKTVILVDDGLATGASMAAAIDALRTRDPARIIVAVPVAPPDTCESLGRRADAIVCLHTPPDMHAIGLWYEDFTQTTDDEVRALLDAVAREQAGRPAQQPHEAGR